MSNGVRHLAPLDVTSFWVIFHELAFTSVPMKMLHGRLARRRASQRLAQQSIFRRAQREISATDVEISPREKRSSK